MLGAAGTPKYLTRYLHVFSERIVTAQSLPFFVYIHCSFGLAFFFSVDGEHFYKRRPLPSGGVGGCPCVCPFFIQCQKKVTHSQQFFGSSFTQRWTTRIFFFWYAFFASLAVSHFVRIWIWFKHRILKLCFKTHTYTHTNTHTHTHTPSFSLLPWEKSRERKSL